MSARHRRDGIPAVLLAESTLNELLWAALMDWLVILLLWGAMAGLWGVAGWAWLLQALIIVLIGGRLHALGVVLHDACHLPKGRLAAQPWATRGLQLLAAYPIATTLAAMRYHHLRHHQGHGLPADPYFKHGASDHLLPAVLGRLRGLLLPLAWHVRPFFGCLVLLGLDWRVTYARVFLGDKSPTPLTSPQTVKELVICLRAEPAQVAFVLILMAIAWWSPKAFLLAYALPLAVAGLANANRVIAEHLHQPCLDTKTTTVLRTTRTHDWGVWGELLLFPHGIGFHAVHHLHPRVGMKRLAALNSWYRQAGVLP
ncbi:fatty acid desaturase family protein [Parachitinimonas caeni]|uniref:Fatty acid desaturase n=1 Tax=Parachitinimonas caeni TaxID=3031301 RepID=A0ABT7DZL5_9NEIS|nr:fatty acid desaturase [Parachitinimonas caeni]MDK2125505.1 fatty acid desaturase [Parachitinimonas caeni]